MSDEWPGDYWMLAAKKDVLVVNYLMREPVTEHEVIRVLHALSLANYSITKREPEKALSKKKAKK